MIGSGKPPGSRETYTGFGIQRAGTGEIDFSEPHATVEMGYPTEATRYTWQSVPLADGTEYGFVVRIATDPPPNGTETQNTGVQVAQANADRPAAPTVGIRLV